jgi:formylglycine-generating enzyme
MRARLGWIVVAGAGAVVLAAVVWATQHDGGPRRCPAGLVEIEARCCGLDQTVELGSCIGAPTSCSSAQRVDPRGCAVEHEKIPVASGVLELAPADWEAQGIVEPRRVDMAAFELDRFEVTEARYLECVEAGSCAALPLTGEPGRPVTRARYDDGLRFCAWAGGDLPTPEQLAFAAAGEERRRYAWGQAGAVCRRAAWGLVRGPCAQGAAGPETAGSRPDGRAPEGFFDLAGNVAEWARSDPSSPMAEARGGSFQDGTAAALRHWHAEELDKNSRLAHVGFRCAYRVPGGSATPDPTADG